MSELVLPGTCVTIKNKTEGSLHICTVLHYIFPVQLHFLVSSHSNGRPSPGVKFGWPIMLKFTSDCHSLKIHCEVL
jgi:hypothetical protein